MEVIKADSPYLSREIIKQCVEQFQEMRITSAPELIVEADMEVVEIDILLVGYFVLFKQFKSDLTIQLRLNANTGHGRIRGTLRQYMVYAHLVTNQDVFNVKYGEEEAEHVNSKSRQAFNIDWYDYSTSFMPIFFIGKDKPTFELYFESKLKAVSYFPVENKLPPGVTYSTVNSELITETKNAIVGSINTDDKRQCMVALGTVAFYQILDRLRVTNIYTDTEYITDGNIRDKLQAGRLIGEDAYTYFEDIRNLLFELVEYPIVYHFTYATLLSSHLLPNELNESTKPEFVKAVFNLWDFTKDLCKGIREIAKNIYEHADPPAGIVTFRLYNAESWKLLKTLQPPKPREQEKHLANMSDERQVSCIEINVADLGGEGIISTMKRKTLELKNSLSEDDKEFFEVPLQEDYDKFQAGEVRLQHLLDPKTSLELHQQTKRSIAHFGLMTLSSLVTSNDGFMLASTWYNSAIEKKRDSLMLTPNIVREAQSTISHGTNFEVVLPVLANKQYTSWLPNPVLSPAEVAVDDVGNIEEIFKYKTIRVSIDADGPPELEKKQKYLFQVSFNGTQITDRSETNAIARKITGLVSQVIKKLPPDAGFITCCDMDTLVIDESHLFRFLALWELRHPKQTMILYNLRTDLFFRLTNLNRVFVEKTGLPFWNDSAATMVYSYVSWAEQSRFYFADCLWGEDRIDYLRLNKAIQRTNFNATSLFNISREMKEAMENNISPLNMNFSPIFMNGNVLMPFDLILEATMQKTLFEYNAMTLLLNEIKP